MAAELFQFLGGVFALMLPGILLAFGLGFGSRRLDRLTHGCCLGLALAIYLGSILSQFNLQWFYPAWLIIGVLALILAVVRKPSPGQRFDSTECWTIAVLVLVAATRFAVALPRITPPTGDPAVYLVLADKLQISHHAPTDWQPFDAAPVTYPAGGAVLVALLSSICRLPTYVIFKDLLPLFGVLATAQIALFTRRLTNDNRAALFAAFCFGVWAGVGSIDVLTGGGFSIELGMLLLVAALSAWLEDAGVVSRIAAASLFYAAMMLSHHHTQLTGAAVVLTITGWMLIRGERKEASLLIVSVLAAQALDVFFLIQFIARAGTISQTNALYSEPPLWLLWYVRRIGYAYLLAAAVGFFFWVKVQRYRSSAICCLLAAGALFIVCEYILPHWVPRRDRFHWTPFSPSHFLADLVFFLAPFAGLAVSTVQERLRLPSAAVLIVMLAVSASQIEIWQDLIKSPDVGRDYVRACRWIRDHTSSDSFVMEGDWGTYLSWRRGIKFRLPDSEQRVAEQSTAQHIANILDGKTAPDSPEMKIVQIDPEGTSKLRVLWRSSSGLSVVQVWPK